MKLCIGLFREWPMRVTNKQHIRSPWSPEDACDLRDPSQRYEKAQRRQLMTFHPHRECCPWDRRAGGARSSRATEKTGRPRERRRKGVAVEGQPRTKRTKHRSRAEICWGDWWTPKPPRALPSIGRPRGRICRHLCAAVDLMQTSRKDANPGPTFALTKPVACRVRRYYLLPLYCQCEEAHDFC